MLCCVGCRWPLWPTLKRQVRSPLQCTSVQRGNYYGKMSTLHLMADADDFFYLLWLITNSIFFDSLDHCYCRFPVKKLFEEEDTVTTDAVEDASYRVKRVKTCFFFSFLFRRALCLLSSSTGTSRRKWLKSTILFPHSEAVSISFTRLVCGLNQQNLQDIGHPEEYSIDRGEGSPPSSLVCNSLKREVWTRILDTF